MWEAVKLVFNTRDRQKLSEAPAREPKKVLIKKVGQVIKDGGAEFEESVVDLEEIERAYYTDSYIRRAVDKYVQLMFKEGWEIPGKNENATEYVWTRLKLMSEATGQPIEEFMREIAFNLVLFGNCFIAKGRQGNLAPGIQAKGYTNNKPVLGYFLMHAPTVQISRDDNGKILKYLQDVGGGNSKEFRPEDVIHFHYNRPTGRAFGIPMIFNVLEDVKILRQIEENVARLIYRNLFPLYQYQVGLDKPGFEASDEEIEEIRDQIRDMPMDGGIVVPERHNITVIGANGAAIDASEYLKYFRQRVFTGLGVSDSVMGIGDSANKSTSDNQSSDLIDGAKDFQSSFSIVFTEKIINELLFEGGFDPVLNIDDEVLFEFFEIALDAKIKKENHAIQLFTQNGITHEEMRQRIGMDPVLDESRLYFNMVTAALSAQAAAEGTEAANNAGDNKNRPENQNGKKTSPGKPKRNKEFSEKDQIESILEENSSNVLTAIPVMVNLNSEQDISKLISSSEKLWNSLREDVISMSQTMNKSDDFIKRFALEPFRQSLESLFTPYIHSFIQEGISKGQEELGRVDAINQTSIRLGNKEIMSLVTKTINRILQDVMTMTEKALKEDSMSQRASLVTGAFESNQYRLSFTAQAELHRSFNYGKALAAEAAGMTSVSSKTNSEKPSQRCKEKAGKPIALSQPRVDLIKAIPAYHPHCQCTVDLTTSTEEV